MEGFEPPTVCSQSRCTTRLCDTPLEIEILEILEIRWDMWELNPGLSPSLGAAPSGCSCPLSQVYCASPHDLTHVWAFCAKLKRSFSKAIYHILGANWSITPNDVLSFNMKCGVSFHGCSKPIAGYLWVFCPIRASYTIEQFALPLIQLCSPWSTTRCPSSR